VVWSSNNKSIAIVSNGVVTALSVGTATVKAVIEGTDIIAACIVTVEEPVIEPSDIAMSQGSLNLIEGGSATLDATILPMGAIGELVWSSSDESVAAVKDGVVLASRAGIATITASVSGTDIKGVCVVTVRGAAVLPASLTLSETSHDLEIGDSFMLRAIIYPAGASGIIVWSSTDRSVATVSNGVVTATGVGIATIKAMIKGTELVAECIVTVKNTVVEPTSIALSQYTLALDAGESYELAAALLPAGSSGTIMWSSSNESVAVVENGVVHALAAGTALIIAFLENTDVTSVCQLSVADDIDDKPRTSITAEELKKGSATERELVESLLGYEGEYEGLDVDARAYSAFTIPSDVSYALASIDASITVRLSNGSIQLPSTDLKKLGSEDVSVSIVKGSIPDPYSRAYKDRPAYEVWVSTESGVPSELDYITVTFPYYLGDGEEPEKVFVAHLGDKIERIPCTFIDNKVTFSTNELSLYAIGYDSDEDDPVPPPDEPTSGLDATWLIAIAIAAVIVVAAAVFIIKKR
jgi:uncharacterized protein YjdB